MEVPQTQQPPTKETHTETFKILRGDLKMLLEEKLPLLKKDTNYPNPGQTGPSDQELPLEEAPKKTSTLEKHAAIMKA